MGVGGRKDPDKRVLWVFLVGLLYYMYGLCIKLFYMLGIIVMSVFAAHLLPLTWVISRGTRFYLVSQLLWME